MNIPRIRSAQVTSPFMLRVYFSNNSIKEYDIRTLIKKYPSYELLKNKNIFQNFHIEPGGYGISWTPEIDVAEYELWEKGKMIEPS